MSYSRSDYERDRLLEEDYAARYGLELPHETSEREHDEHLEQRDRLAVFDERRVRALLRPRTGNVSPAPRDCPLDEAA